MTGAVEVAPVEGEIVEYLTVEKAEELTSDIIDAFDSMREFAEIARASVRKAIDHQVWVTLGYESFEAYAKDRFAACHAHANEMIEALAGEFSSRTIAAVTGKSQSTVTRRLSQSDSVHNIIAASGAGKGRPPAVIQPVADALAVAEAEWAARKVTGRDGVKRPAKAPTKAKVPTTAIVAAEDYPLTGKMWNDSLIGHGRRLREGMTAALQVMTVQRIHAINGEVLKAASLRLADVAVDLRTLRKRIDSELNRRGTALTIDRSK